MSPGKKSNGGRYCVAPGCRNYECDIKNVTDEPTNQLQHSITYHNFPTKSSLRNKWFKFIGHDNNRVSSLTWRTWTLCSEHFADSEFEENCHLECIDGIYIRSNVKLKNGAVPTKSKLPSPPQSIDDQNQIERNSMDFSTTQTINDNTINCNLKNEYNEIDFDNETIYTELDDDFHSKCGEVFVTRKGIFLYFCTFCNENLDNPHLFTKHIYEEHLSLGNDTGINNLNINNDIKNDEENIKLLPTIKNTIKVPLPLQHCEIVENEAGNFETISFFDDDDFVKNNVNEINQNLYTEIQEKKIIGEEFKKPKVELEKNNYINLSSENHEIINIIDLTDDDNIDNSTDNVNINNDEDKISIKNEAVIENNPVEISNLNCNSEVNVENISNFNNSTNINSLLKNPNLNCLNISEITNSSNNEEILPAAYNDNEFVEADDDDIGNEHDEDDDWYPINKKHFKCKYCPRVLKSQLSLTVHTRSHTGERPFKCNICSRNFKSQGILYNHAKIHTGVKPFQCKICGLTLSTHHNLNIHEKRHETQLNQYKCPYCDKKFLRLKNKVLHQRTHNIDMKHEPDEEINILMKNFKCDFCFKILSSQYSLMEHRRIHTGEKPFLCKFCPSAFRSKLLKMCHERSNHTGERPFSCIYCEKAFVLKSTRDNHERIHSKERPFKCDLCDKTFRQASAKYIHKKSHFRPKIEDGSKSNRTRRNSITDSVQSHGDKKKYQCKYCNKILSTPNVLIEHRRIHTGEKPYSCNICNNKFRTKSTLFYHVQSHSNEKPYECKYCQKKFRLAANMVTHHRTHTGEKPFRCSYCDKCFTQRQNQVIHEKTHIPGYKRREKVVKDKIWKCDICEKNLINKYTLSNHMRTHTGERPFKCSYCPSAFKSLSQHSQHERIHSGIKPHKCSECDKAFTSKSQLNVHTRRHTAKKSKPEIHKCDKCEKEFKFNSSLILHQRRHDKSNI